MSKYDLIIKGGKLVIPDSGVITGDLGIHGEKIATIAERIEVEEGDQVIDAEGKYVFPGAVDSHFHIGIYRPFSDDARSESASAASGGVTTLVSYFRTGKSYLNKVAPFKEIFPELMELSGNAFVTDYGYHIALMTSEQMNEMEWLVEECGVSTFKYYMFYKKLDLSGSSKSGNRANNTRLNISAGKVKNRLSKACWETFTRRFQRKSSRQINRVNSQTDGT